MMIRRIFAGSIVALLLSVFSIGAACDLSCAFSSMNLDCHSRQAIQGSSSSGMNMSGMNMAGMDMQETADGGEQPSVSAIAEGKGSHPSIGEMGLCERKACNNGTAVSAKTNRLVSSNFHSVPAFLGTPRTDGSSPHFRNARDDVDSSLLRGASPLHQTLRI
jgi:hypothetical protein